MSAIVAATVVADALGDVTVVLHAGDDLPVVLRVDDTGSGDYLRLALTAEVAADLLDQLGEALVGAGERDGHPF